MLIRLKRAQVVQQWAGLVRRYHILLALSKTKSVSPFSVNMIPLVIPNHPIQFLVPNDNAHVLYL